MPKTVYGVHPTVPLSSVVNAGDLLFVSGQLPFGEDGRLIYGGIVEQTRQAILNIQAALQPLGAGLGDIVKTTVWLTDKNDFAGFNDAYREFFAEGPPARSTVVSALVLDVRVEIEAIAYLKLACPNEVVRFQS
ncbi:RidA family protein [Chelativorans xinjiangense]|uniref:RidA family protein n=1 Tax=Chelativorans xinjiangense TaxID=2681485 RepID=UPI0013599BE6|nr:RidA family protein [Chelativorans xinjiangense]